MDRLGWANGMLAQGICLEAHPDVGSDVSGVTEWGALSGKSEQHLLISTDASLEKFLQQWKRRT